MKKIALISCMVFISFLFISQGLLAQRYYRGGPGIEDDYYDLNLTQEQMEKIDKLELELERELSPLISKLRSNYMELDELGAQGSYDPTKIKKILDLTNKLEDDIGNKEISHEKKIRDLLTQEQRIIFDSYYGYGLNQYDRGGFGRGYFGRGFRGFRGGNYGYGAGRLSGSGKYRYYSRFRYGRGPCGAGLGKWYRWDYSRGRWN